jgi:hypothetical protein
MCADLRISGLKDRVIIIVEATKPYDRRCDKVNLDDRFHWRAVEGDTLGMGKHGPAAELAKARR